MDLKKLQGSYSFAPSLFDNISLGQPLPPFDNPSQVSPAQVGFQHIMANQSIPASPSKKIILL